MRLILPIMCLAIVACSESPESAAQKAVAAQLNDPESAQFRNVNACPGSSDMTMGEVNAKNAFGGYVGFRTFFVDRGVVTLIDDDMLSKGGGLAFADQLAARCRGDAS